MNDNNKQYNCSRVLALLMGSAPNYKDGFIQLVIKYRLMYVDTKLHELKHNVLALCVYVFVCEAVYELTKTGGAPVVLHGLVTGFCILCLLCSALTLLIALYNSVSNPYETYMGPISIYISSSIGSK